MGSTLCSELRELVVNAPSLGDANLFQHLVTHRIFQIEFQLVRVQYSVIVDFPKKE